MSVLRRLSGVTFCVLIGISLAAGNITWGGENGEEGPEVQDAVEAEEEDVRARLEQRRREAVERLQRGEQRRSPGLAALLLSEAVDVTVSEGEEEDRVTLVLSSADEEILQQIRYAAEEMLAQREQREARREAARREEGAREAFRERLRERRDMDDAEREELRQERRRRLDERLEGMDEETRQRFEERMERMRERRGGRRGEEQN